MYSFGSGSLWGINSAANSTPVRFGGIQDVSVEIQFNVKELYGQSQFPLAIGRGKGKIACKAKLATINGRTFNDLFFGQALAVGSNLTSIDEGPTAIPGTPFTITVVNAATFQTDLGVFNVTTGLWMQKVASAPATGQYSVSGAGVYTFAAADTTNQVKISYTYTSAAAGKQIAISNQLLGVTPLFQAVFTSTFLSKAVTLTLNRCTSIKLNFATKLEDFTIPELDFAAVADDSGNIGNLSLAE